jgi:hypothetical protein
MKHLHVLTITYLATERKFQTISSEFTVAEASTNRKCGQEWITKLYN